MTNTLFRDLRAEIKRDYRITKGPSFIPFESWRSKLRTYPKEFDEEYARNISLLKERLGFVNLREVDNPNKKLILFVGIPGSGKTTLAKIVQEKVPKTLLLRGHDVVDILELYGKNVELYKRRLKERKFTYPDPWYISYLYQEQLTRDCLQLGYNVVFDDHIRTRLNRLGYHKLAEQNGAKSTFVQINAPFETTFRRYLGREKEKIDDENLKFLANMVFQSEDIGEAERRKYNRIIMVDGTLSLRELEKSLPKLIA